MAERVTIMVGLVIGAGALALTSVALVAAAQNVAGDQQVFAGVATFLVIPSLEVGCLAGAVAFSPWHHGPWQAASRLARLMWLFVILDGALVLSRLF